MTKTSAAKILGVDANAPKETIKKAYRRKARQHHPDVGGKREDFERIQIAMDTLTGEDKEPSMAAKIFLETFTMASQNSNYKQEDLIKKTIGHLQRAINDLQMQKEQTKRVIATTKDMLDRITCKRPDDILRATTENAIAGLEQQIRVCEHRQEDVKAAIKIAEEYEYRVDAPEPPVQWASTTSTSFFS